jgi:pyruvate dehydrogenase E1 component beta subunit
VLRDGSDVTLVTWGASTRETLAAAEALEREGVEAEVIDVATIAPLDMRTILESVQKTGRCVIVHEAARNVGVGAEIAARLADEGLLTLLAPVKRVTGYDTVVPYAKLETDYLPQTDRIVTAVRQTLEAA